MNACTRPPGPQVHNDDEVRVLFRAVAGEVPGSPIFAMKLAPCSRHLEVGGGEGGSGGVQAGFEGWV